MSRSQIRYTHTTDGKSIAYSVAGSGSTVVWLPTFIGATRGPAVSALRGRYRVATYDSRGQGLSTRGLDPDHEWGHWEIDLDAVIDALGCEKVALVGACHSGAVAVRYAVHRPERVSALVLVSTCVRATDWGPETFWNQVAYEDWDFFLTKLIPRTVSPDQVGGVLDAIKASITPEEYRVFDAVVTPGNIAQEAPQVSQPTLVVHPRNFDELRPELSAELASLIPGARFALIDGGERGMYGDGDQLVELIEEFLAGTLQELPALAEQATIPESLTRREVEVLQLIASGRSNREIADELVLSIRTVERHITNLYAKIGARSKSSATAFALHSGLV